MPRYRYRAVHPSGRVTRGVATASNENDLAQFLGQSQLELIEAKESKNSRQKTKRHSSVWRKVSPRALTLFCIQMGDLLKAGVPFLDALGDLATALPQGRLREALQDVMRGLNHGSRIADSFARHPAMFPPVFVAILASGEVSGDMARAFEQLAAYVEGRAKMNERLARALRYPLFLLGVALAVTSFMMLLVVPQIVSFLQSIDGQLPPATRLLIAVSQFFGAVWWMAGLLIIVCIAAVVVGRRTSISCARYLDKMMLRLPVLGAVLQKIMLARFAHCFSILVQSGLTVPAALQGARDTLGNRALEFQLDDVSRQITSGSPLSLAMAGLLPPSALRMLRIGEQGGGLAKSLGDIAAIYDREAADSADTMIGMLEPGLTLLIGALLAWVVMAVLGPIYGSLSHMNMV